MRKCRAQRGVARPGPVAQIGAQHPDLLDQVLAKARLRGDAAVALGLRQVVDRAERQAAQGDLGVALGQGRHHHDLEPRALGQHPGQRLGAVELGHLDVERHQIRLELADRLERDGYEAFRGNS